MGDDSEENSNSITEIEADEDEVEDNEDNALSNDQLANSDVEIAHKLVVAPCNKTSNAAPTSCASGKAQQAWSYPSANNSANEGKDDDDGKSLSTFICGYELTVNGRRFSDDY